MTNKKAALESLLFVSGEDGLSMEEMTSLLEATPLEVHNLIVALKDKYTSDSSSGLTLIESRQRYQLATKKEYAELIRQFAISPFSARLSQAALETLAIVAYKQPITRMEIDELRGVQSSSLLQRLLMRGLVKEMGRAEAPGRPIIYGTTDYFMNYFGLSNLEDLPSTEVFLDMDEKEVFHLFQEDPLLDARGLENTGQTDFFEERTE